MNNNITSTITVGNRAYDLTVPGDLTLTKAEIAAISKSVVIFGCWHGVTVERNHSPFGMPLRLGSICRACAEVLGGVQHWTINGYR
jgi:hypothetical protein